MQGLIFAADPTSTSGSRNVTPVITFPNAAPRARVTALAGGGFLLTWSGGAQAFDASGQAVTGVTQILDGVVAASADRGFVVLAQVGSELLQQHFNVPS